MENWNEKTTLQKVALIISGIALCAWLVFEYLGSKKNVAYADTAGLISICIVCVCEAIEYWKSKRIFSYVAIAGIVCIVTALILFAL